ELYDGDLLEGWYHDWCIFERERLQGMYLAMLDKLVAHAECMADFATAVHYCELSLRCDPARERTHRRLMRLHALAGNRTAALRQFELCRAMLADELGVEPAQSTVALYEHIRQDSLGAHGESAVPADASGVGDILRRLRTVHATLTAALDQVQQDIEAVERMIQRTR
ncbi:MAG: bacterial transcriptional activator domain-containing protein, partial [Caldilineaceae bacterium]|nr:bacterial transcriptional activator domain-containing protein [Caldilineaceae bacterium]